MYSRCTGAANFYRRPDISSSKPTAALPLTALVVMFPAWKLSSLRRCSLSRAVSAASASLRSRSRVSWMVGGELPGIANCTGGCPSFPIGRNGSRLALTKTGISRRGEDMVMLGTPALGGEELASKDDMMSLPCTLSCFVLTLYRPNFKRVRSSSARDFLDSGVGAVVGAEVGAGTNAGASAGADSTTVACSLF
jgi:hypothetical protein